MYTTISSKRNIYFSSFYLVNMRVSSFQNKVQCPTVCKNPVNAWPQLVFVHVHVHVCMFVCVYRQCSIHSPQKELQISMVKLLKWQIIRKCHVTCLQMLCSCEYTIFYYKLFQPCWSRTVPKGDSEGLFSQHSDLCHCGTAAAHLWPASIMPTRCPPI